MTPKVKTALAIVLGIAVLVGAYLGGRYLEKQNEKPETRGDYHQREAFEPVTTFGENTYRRRKNLTTILLMGVDSQTDAPESTGYRNGGQADFLRVVVVDSGRKLISQIQIDRDTMTPITILGVMGNRSGVRTSQICLAHGFGDGKEQSCQLTAEAVSNLLYGVPIDFYMAMQMDGISVLNDSVGGITVTLQDDFSMLDAAMTKGKTLTLAGDQAELYVRSRRSIGVATNEARMQRQEAYIAQLTDVLNNRFHDDKAFVGTLYDALDPYLTTNLSRGRLINETWAAREYEHAPLLKPDGSYEVGEDGFMQFHVNQAALEQAIVDLFYEQTK